MFEGKPTKPAVPSAYVTERHQRVAVLASTPRLVRPKFTPPVQNTKTISDMTKAVANAVFLVLVRVTT